jgi:hypothetical protein
MLSFGLKSDECLSDFVNFLLVRSNIGQVQEFIRIGQFRDNGPLCHMDFRWNVSGWISADVQHTENVRFFRHLEAWSDPLLSP